MISVLIADDHPVVRSGVRSLLRGEANIRVAAEAKTAAEVLQQIGSRDFDVILLDVTLPDGSGVDLIPHVRRKSPFRQTAGSHRDGLGLGLFIVQQIMTSHGGSIELTQAGGQVTLRTVWPRQSVASDPAAAQT